MKRALGSALLLALLAACVPARMAPQPEAPDIERLCSEHRYLTALKTLNTRRAAVADYDAEQRKILDQARAYQDQVLRDAAELARQQEYVQALALLDNAQAELPVSRELTQAAEQLTAARERAAQSALDELLPLKAAQLQRNHALYQALQKSAAGTPELNDAVARHMADVAYFAPLIAQTGARALAQNEFGKAQQWLAIANQLQPSPQLEQELARAEKGLNSTRRKQQVAQSAEREQRYRELSNALLQSLQQRDFRAAREQLALARELNIHTEEMDSAQRLLDNIIANYVAQQVDAGDRFYAEGRIEDALRCWRQAEALAPTPDIVEKIDKAKKFIGRLQQLQSQPAKPAR